MPLGYVSPVLSAVALTFVNLQGGSANQPEETIPQQGLPGSVQPCSGPLIECCWRMKPHKAPDPGKANLRRWWSVVGEEHELLPPNLVVWGALRAQTCRHSAD